MKKLKNIMNQPSKLLLKPGARIVIEDDQKVKIVITKEIKENIEYLLEKIPDTEWSGVIFFSSKKGGDFLSKKFISRKMFLGDIGEPGSTQFEYTDEMLDYMLEEGVLEQDYLVATIHSHHNMDAYFSSTDWQNLADCANAHMLYLSIIVNNVGKIIAKTSRGAVVTQIAQYKADFSGKKTKRNKIEVKGIIVNDVDITVEKKPSYIDENLKQKTEELLSTRVNSFNKNHFNY